MAGKIVADGGGCGPSEERRVFLIEALETCDVLQRVLAPFAVQGVRIAAADLTQCGGRAVIRIEVANMAAGRAETLAERLRGMPAILGVGMVWRAGRSVAEGSQTFL